MSVTANEAARAAIDWLIQNTDFSKVWVDHRTSDSKTDLIDCVEFAIQKCMNDNSSPPLFTRTVYTVADLHAQIDAIEALGFTSYVIERDSEHVVPKVMLPPYNRPRWIIKVYREETE